MSAIDGSVADQQAHIARLCDAMKLLEGRLAKAEAHAKAGRELATKVEFAVESMDADSSQMYAKITAALKTFAAATKEK